jgi:hypothetical protein
LIYNSKYKNIDSDILAEWVSDLNLDELKSQIEIPELKLDFDNIKDEKDYYEKEENKYIIEIECVNELDQENKFNHLTSQGFKCRVLTL